VGAANLLPGAYRGGEREFPFEMRGLRLEGARLSFSIKPAGGFKLSKITRLLMNISS
jgi:hypothetical protein